MNLNFLLNPKIVRAIQFEADLSNPSHRCSFALLKYWERKRASDGCIRREDVEPRDLLPLLPWIFILEPLPNDWRIRLFGTRLCSRIGADVTGATLRGLLEPDSAANLVALYRDMATNCAPKTLRGRYFEQGHLTAITEVMQLPMLARGGQPMHLLCGAFFLDRGSDSSG